MPFIDEILAQTDLEIARAKKDRSIGDLKRMMRDAPPLRSFHSALNSGFGLVAEIKKRSPSAGEMRSENFDNAPAAYAKSSVVKAVSVLTNSSHFGMGVDHLARVKPLVRKPVLRKDFIRKEYQIYEARAFGADAILLMANFLDKDDLRRLFNLASEISLDVLFEAHTKEEIDSIPDGAKIYGINSRRFMATKRWWFTKMFVRVGLGKSSKAPDPSVELSTFSLINHIPKHALKIAESGVKPGRVSEIVSMGYDAVLVGTSILKSPDGVESSLCEFEREIRPDLHGIASVESLSPA